MPNLGNTKLMKHNLSTQVIKHKRNKLLYKLCQNLENKSY